MSLHPLKHAYIWQKLDVYEHIAKVRDNYIGLSEQYELVIEKKKNEIYMDYFKIVEHQLKVQKFHQKILYIDLVIFS